MMCLHQLLFQMKSCLFSGLKLALHTVHRLHDEPHSFMIGIQVGLNNNPIYPNHIGELTWHIHNLIIKNQFEVIGIKIDSPEFLFGSSAPPPASIWRFSAPSWEARSPSSAPWACRPRAAASCFPRSAGGSSSRPRVRSTRQSKIKQQHWSCHETNLRLHCYPERLTYLYSKCFSAILYHVILLCASLVKNIVYCTSMGSKIISVTEITYVRLNLVLLIFQFLRNPYLEQ